MLESYAEIQEEYQMIYTDKTKKAMKLCYEAHKDQVDKSGLPYVFHPAHVAEQMTDEATTIVALLHDVVEDTDYTLEDLAAEGKMTYRIWITWRSSKTTPSQER